MQFLYSHLKKLEQQQRDRPNPLTRKQLTKIRAEINQLETRSTVEHINRTRSWFFERINKIGRALARLIQKKREGTQIIKIMNEKERSLPTPMKLEGLLETFINSYMPKN